MRAFTATGVVMSVALVAAGCDQGGGFLRGSELIVEDCEEFGDQRTFEDYELALDLLESGKAPLTPLVTHRYSLEEIDEGFRAAYNKKTTGSIKVQIVQS